MNNFFRAIVLLSMFLLLDLIKPFGYYLYVEFLFLGIIFYAFYMPVIFSIFIAFIFGYMKSLFSFSNVSIFEFPSVVIFIYYFQNKFKYNFVKFIVLILSIFFHITINVIYFKAIPFLFLVRFFIQSIIIYFFLLYKKQWMISLSKDYM